MAYFPNGTSGEVLDQQCSDCYIPDNAPCPILAVQIIYNYKQCDKKNKDLRKAMNLLIDDNGNCLMKVEIDKMNGGGYVEGEQYDTARIMLNSIDSGNQ